MMIGEIVHYVGIPKHSKIFQTFHTEFIVNLQGDALPDITYKQFERIMNEMHDLHLEEPIYEVVTEPLHLHTLSFNNKVAENWIKQRCSWKDKQYEIDNVYTGSITDIPSIMKYVFITLKTIFYTTIPYPISIVKMDVSPEHVIETSLTEGTDQFDAIYTVVRRNKEEE